MPAAPKHPCRHPGCSVLLEAGRGAWCPAHARAPRQVTRMYDRHRGSAHERGYDARWRAAARGFLARYPLCVGTLIPDMMIWTRTLAAEFHALREQGRESGGLLLYSLPATRYSLLPWLRAHPIYRLEPWDVSRPATVVDHIIPHKGDDELFWSEWNWQPLTKRAHDKKTARESKRPRTETMQ